LVFDGRTGHGMKGRAIWLLVLAGLVSSGPSRAESPRPQLKLGDVMIGIGEPIAVVIDTLAPRFKTRAIGGGWEVRGRDPERLTPIVAIGVRSGSVVSVSFHWGPGLTPSFEEMAEQLALAVPSGAACSLSGHSGPFEGDMTRMFKAECGQYEVSWGSAVGPRGNNSAHIAVHLQEN